MSARTFQVQQPHIEGDDVRLWQQTLNAQLKRWNVDHQIKVDGDYGIGTRSLSSTVLYGLGIPQAEMAHGVTPELRVKVRNRRLSTAERARWTRRIPWREKLRRRYAPVSSPMAHIEQDSWGWHPGVHDGLDLTCPKDEPLRAICDGEIVRADASGWWGKAPSGNVALGDGIIIIRCSIRRGPFRKGLNLCYGHAEHATVKKGDKVKAGQIIGKAGLAVVPHVHFMVNGLSADSAGFVRGVGDRDPRPYYDYARKHD